MLQTDRRPSPGPDRPRGTGRDRRTPATGAVPARPPASGTEDRRSLWQARLADYTRAGRG
jgi:hypothetical protein